MVVNHQASALFIRISTDLPIENVSLSLITYFIHPNDTETI